MANMFPSKEERARRAEQNFAKLGKKAQRNLPKTQSRIRKKRAKRKRAAANAGGVMHGLSTFSERRMQEEAFGIHRRN